MSIVSTEVILSNSFGRCGVAHVLRFQDGKVRRDHVDGVVSEVVVGIGLEVTVQENVNHEKGEGEMERDDTCAMNLFRHLFHACVTVPSPPCRAILSAWACGERLVCLFIGNHDLPCPTAVVGGRVVLVGAGQCTRICSKKHGSECCKDAVSLQWNGLSHDPSNVVRLGVECQRSSGSLRRSVRAARRATSPGART